MKGKLKKLQPSIPPRRSRKISLVLPNLRIEASKKKKERCEKI